jgi:hypothetical protein
MSSSGYVRSMIGRNAPLSRRDRRCSRISWVSIGRGKTTLRGPSAKGRLGVWLGVWCLAAAE